MITVSKTEFVEALEGYKFVRWPPVEFDGYMYVLIDDELVRCKL